ncbi:MAG: complex I NDUFA9 subunit family protein [Gammaproteobacteria bacterium]|nr:complex I NDUFA9 subunit family protein [Gammaproteobacteria bacterium]
MKSRKVCILGGTGFVGRHLIYRLTSQGVCCRIPSRHPQRHRTLGLYNATELVQCDPFQDDQLNAAVTGCDTVINLTGILNEAHSGTDFQRVHVELTERVVKACGNAGIERLLHMSALNADETEGPSDYLKTKGRAENLAHTLGLPQLKVTSFQPSVIFGPGDSFFNRFADLLKAIPGPFPLACPEARFAPVYVGDVTQAFSHALNNEGCWGKRYQLCGPQIFTLRELVEYTATQLGLEKRIFGLSDGMSRLQARIMDWVPGKPFSSDNYRSLQIDSLCSQNGLEKLGIMPATIDSVVPFYLSEKSERRRYQLLRKLG